MVFFGEDKSNIKVVWGKIGGYGVEYGVEVLER